MQVQEIKTPSHFHLLMALFQCETKGAGSWERELESSNLKLYLPSLEVFANVVFFCVSHKS